MKSVEEPHTIPLSSKTSEVLRRARKKSEFGLKTMRNIATEMFQNESSIVIGVNGSYARREVTSRSDVDLFFLYSAGDDKGVQCKQKQFRDQLEQHREPVFRLSDGGLFKLPISIDKISETIGGFDDDNKHITRRMLLLLEGEYVFNQKVFNDTRENLLKRYVPSDIREDQICLYLLNDIIRYWRTICVDYEHKTRDPNKPGVIRLVKLRFSRMMLFVAGVLAVSKTFELPREGKISKLNELLAIPPYERIQEIVGKESYPALNLYAKFLEALDDEAVRNKLSQPSEIAEKCEEYQELVDAARNFRRELLKILYRHCNELNPTLDRLML